MLFISLMYLHILNAAFSSPCLSFSLLCLTVLHFCFCFLLFSGSGGGSASAPAMVIHQALGQCVFTFAKSKAAIHPNHYPSLGRCRTPQNNSTHTNTQTHTRGGGTERGEMLVRSGSLRSLLNQMGSVTQKMSLRGFRVHFLAPHPTLSDNLALYK